MSNLEIAQVAVDGEIPHEKIPQEKTRGRSKSKRREASSDAMSALDKKLSRMRDAMIEFVDSLDDVGSKSTTSKRRFAKTSLSSSMKP